MATKNYTLNDTKRWLRKCYPIPAKVRIYKVRPKTLNTYHGCKVVADCVLSEDHKQVWIRISKTLTEYEAIDALLHEWPHALRELSPIPFQEGVEDVHDNLYWQIYGVIYGAFHGPS